MKFKKAYRLILKYNIEVLKNEVLKNHSTIRIGGYSKLFIKPKNITELKKTLIILKQLKIKHFLVGNGSNVLFSSAGYFGAIIKLSGEFISCEIKEKSLVVGSGFLLPTLARMFIENGFSGLEWAVQIPATVGGALNSNAGAFGGNIGQIVESVSVLCEDGEVRQILAQNCEFSYRNSVFKKRQLIILNASFKIEKKDKSQLLLDAEKFKKIRDEKQPKGFSLGSIFCNGDNFFAAQIIEKLKLKGFSVGEAYISEKHSNFILNRNNAKSYNVLKIIKRVKVLAKKHFFVILKEEIKVLKK